MNRRRSPHDATPRPRRRFDRAAVLVEAAVIMPLLIMLAMGTMEFGLAWRNRLDVQNSVRSGARTAAALGNDPQADYNILQMLKAGMGSRFASTKRIVIYKAVTTDGALPSVCQTGGSQTGLCNVYTVAQASLASTSFGCGTGAIDAAWCPTARVADVNAVAGLDYVGVYVEVDHQLITGAFGRGKLVITDRAVMRSEPR
jgi:TadE-like protein